MDPTLLRSVKFFTRKNGRLYTCTYGNNTLINNGDTVTCVLNNHGLEPGVLQYVCEFQIPDQTYPDFYKKIHQFYVSDIELVKGNGEQLEVDVEAMFGTTIDGKFNDLEANIDEVSEEVDVISANIIAIQELNSIQDASINHIEDVIATIDGGTSETIQRLDTSVNALQSDVTSLNSTVDSLQADTENIATGLTTTTNKVDDVSTRVDNMETVLGRKADVSVLGNYYTKDETYNKDEVDRAIADAAMDGSLPAGIVIDNNYVHTDNNYTNADKAKVRDFDLSLYPTNASLIENYATKAELQNVDENHPSNSSVSNNYVKKNDMSNYLSDYPTNSSVSSNYATKAQIQVCIDENDLTEVLADYPTNSSVSDNYVHWLYANENYVSYENIDEIFYNLLENSQRTENKIEDIVSDSSTISDISTNVSDVSVKVDDVSLKVKDVSLVSLDISTRLTNDYLTAQVVNRDFVKNTSLNDYVLNSSLSTNYTTKDEFNEVWTTFVTAEQVDDTYAKIVDVSNHLTTNDISTFKPIVFCTQEEYDTLVENDQVDTNTVYMLSGDQTGGDYLTPDDVSNFVTNSSLNDVLSDYTTLAYLDEQLLQVDGNITNLLSNYVQNVSLNNDVSNLGYLKKNTDIEVSKVIFTGYENVVNSYLDYTQQEDEIYLNLGLPDTDAGGELTDRQIVAARSEYDGDSERTELTFGGTATWTNLGNKWGNVNVKAKNVSIGSGSGNINILGQNVSIGGRNVNDFITSNDVSAYATTSYVDTIDSSIVNYVDTQIGNIQNILQTI